MDIDVFPAKDLKTVFSVLRTALRHSGPLAPRERLFLATCARITGYRLPETDPIPLIAPEVHIEGALQRKRVIQLAAIAALFNNPVTPGSARFLRELSWQLKTRDPVVAVVDAVEKGRRFGARLLAWLFLRPSAGDGFPAVALGILATCHGIPAPRAASAPVSNEIRGTPLETAA